MTDRPPPATGCGSPRPGPGRLRPWPPPLRGPGARHRGGGVRRRRSPTHRRHRPSWVHPHVLLRRDGWARAVGDGSARRLRRSYCKYMQIFAFLCNRVSGPDRDRAPGASRIRVGPVNRAAALADALPISYWLDDPAAPPVAPPLVGRTTADLTVVGGGYTGLWTALLAKTADPERRRGPGRGRPLRLGGLGSERRFLRGQRDARLGQRGRSVSRRDRHPRPVGPEEPGLDRDVGPGVVDRL